MTARPTWTYSLGLPDRSGLAKYTHLIRSDLDPDETMKRGAGQRDPKHWRKTDSVEAWRDRIRAHLEDGEPRTFHTICVELTGTNGDVWFELAPDRALWELVDARELAWHCRAEGGVFFLLAKFLSSSSAEP